MVTMRVPDASVMDGLAQAANIEPVVCEVGRRYPLIVSGVGMMCTSVVGSWPPDESYRPPLALYFNGQMDQRQSETILKEVAAVAIAQQQAFGLDEYTGGEASADSFILHFPRVLAGINPTDEFDAWGGRGSYSVTDPLGAPGGLGLAVTFGIGDTTSRRALCAAATLMRNLEHRSSGLVSLSLVHVSGRGGHSSAPCRSQFVLLLSTPSGTGRPRLWRPRASDLFSDEACRVREELGIQRNVATCLESQALIIVDTEPHRAACLFGYAEVLRESLQIALVPAERAAHRIGVAAVREAMGASSFAIALA
jgi:hypothetical protein